MKAGYAKGVLTIHLGKRAEARPKQIKVEVTPEIAEKTVAASNGESGRPLQCKEGDRGGDCKSHPLGEWMDSWNPPAPLSSFGLEFIRRDLAAEYQNRARRKEQLWQSVGIG